MREIQERSKATLHVCSPVDFECGEFTTEVVGPDPQRAGHVIVRGLDLSGAEYCARFIGSRLVAGSLSDVGERRSQP